jgi:hypothetical protein
MGGFKITGLGAGTVGTDAVRLSQLQAGTAQLLAVSGTDTLTALGTPTLTAYATGNTFYFVAAATNTTSVTLNVDGLGAKAVTRHGSTALVAGDILAGEVCLVVYDGTRFQLLNPASYTNLNVSGVLSLAAGAVGTPSLAAFGDVNTGLWFPAADTLAASVGGVEGWRLTSTGNLGIGTSSPGTRLHTNKASQTPGDTTPSGAFLITNTTAGAGCVEIGSGSSVLGYLQVRNSGSQTYYDFALQPNGGNVGIGTSSPGAKLDVQAATLDIAGVSTTGTNYVRQRMTNTGGDFYYGIDGSAGANFGFPYAAVLWYTGNNSMVFGTNNSRRMEIDGSGNVMAGGASLATTATNGFLYVPTCAGVPTGTPTAKTGYAPIVVDTTNNRWYFYSGGAWRNAGP